MTIEIRGFNEKDMPVLVALLNETYRGDYEFRPLDEEWIRSQVHEGKLKILIAEETGKIIGSAAYHDSFWGEEVEWLAVPERPNRKLLENTLVSKVEKFVKSGKIFRAVDAGSPKIDEWTERGYRMEGGLYHMTVKLDGLTPLPSIPEGIILRSLRTTEEAEFVKAVNVGFGTERVKLGDIQTWKIDSPPFNEEWVHVAEIEDKIVSVVVAKPDTYYNKFFNGKRGYLGPAATLEEHRSKNLATALTVRAMNFLFEKGMNSAALYTSEKNVASVTLLRKIGFQVGHNWKFMRKEIQQQIQQKRH